MRKAMVAAVALTMLAAGCSGPRTLRERASPGRVAHLLGRHILREPLAERLRARSVRVAGVGPADDRAGPAVPVSLPLFGKRYDGRRLGREVLVRTDAYTQRAVTFRSDGLTISGVMNIPNGRGPFPVLVLAHGYIDPAIYVTGQGLRREQD